MKRQISVTFCAIFFLVPWPQCVFSGKLFQGVCVYGTLAGEREAGVCFCSAVQKLSATSIKLFTFQARQLAWKE